MQGRDTSEHQEALDVSTVNADRAERTERASAKHAFNLSPSSFAWGSRIIVSRPPVT